MARALARGFVQAGLITTDQLFVSDPVAEATREFTQVVGGGRVKATNQEVVREADMVWLAVKPQHLDAVFQSLEPEATPLYVSIVAGVKLDRLERELGSQRVIRVMPNTPCLIGSGAAAYAWGPAASDEDRLWVARLLEAVGRALPVPEPLLDAVTGLSGSGPAYTCLFIEALSDGGVAAGLGRAAALELAAQTVLGTARLILESGEHPAVLKDRVASPAGTTIAGLQQLEAHGFRAAAMAAVAAAARRAAELG